MKVLQVITSLYTGGAEKLLVDMTPMFRDCGYDVDVLLLNGDETPFKRQLEAHGVKVCDLGHGSVYKPLKLFKLLPYMRQYDIVHTHNTASQLFAAICSLVCPPILVTTEHNTSNRRRNMTLFKWIDKWMYSRYKSIICISDKAAENLKSYLGNDKNVSIIYNGIDCKLYTNTLGNAKWRNGKTIVTMVAGFRKQKDQDTLIKAMELLPKDKYELWLVGDGERRPLLEQLVKENELTDTVKFWGLRSDIPVILKSSDIIVMSSHYEGLSLSSIEGMSVGKPFVASDVDGLHEITAGAGVLFPHGDAQALANVIEKLAKDKDYSNDVAFRCMKRASEYDISKTVEAYLQIYNSLAINKQ